MTPGMRTQDHLLQPFVVVLITLVGTLALSGDAAAQALYSERLPGDIDFILISQPLSQATTVAWPWSDGSVVSITSGDLTLSVDLERVMAELVMAPPVVVAVGGAQVAELRPVLERTLGERFVDTISVPRPAVIEGGVDRRLGAPGADAQLRLEVELPPADDWRRSTVEVLWELLPGLLAGEVGGLSSRVTGNTGLLETRVAPEIAEITLSRLRLELARVSADPGLDAAPLEAARQRVHVRRQALLGTHPDGAEKITSLWLDGGETAVREYLFGIEGVTLDAVRSAALQWLPQHPGHAVLLLPPRVFNPRFAPAPQRVQLDNDAVAAVLERPSAGLSAVCLRPVVVPDVDGGLTGTVLTRLAAEVRSHESAPGWVRVRQNPPVLEMAASAEGLAEQIEVLQMALDRVSGDERSIGDDGGDARLRALRLMAGVLGLTEGVTLTPRDLLQASNLAIGVVAPDAEAAIEALHKFRIGGSTMSSSLDSRALAPVPRTREAAAGDESVVVVALELFPPGGEVRSMVLSALIEARAKRLLPEHHVEVLAPLVPGRSVLLLVVRATTTLDELEQTLRDGWQDISAPAEEIELAKIRRGLASRIAVLGSGVLGHARRCAAVAAGEIIWRLPSELEMEALTLAPEMVEDVLAGIKDWQALEVTGAGVLPIIELEN